jgi:predicted RND superfamily exporter protein
MQVTVTTSSGQDTRVDAKVVQDIRETLDKLGPSDDIVITGLRALIAEEFPKLINQLRQGLLIAVFLAVGIVILATRSWRMGFAALVPNMLPILFAESMILVSGSRLDITNVIALTVAFGIAIDNAVHIINSYSAQRRAGMQGERAVRNAVREIGPALVASTAILSITAVITQFSPMPSVATLGRLLILTLVLALACNLTILPAYIRLIAGSGKMRSE